MAEYITKKAAINAVENAPIKLFQSELEEIEEAINAAPAADVAPVVHGRWERRRNVWYCTNCGKGYKITYGAVAANMHNYCPHCGAKMDDEPIPVAEIDETR